MAPEYARGGLVDVTCDLYSLGVVLYELLAGHRPFTAEHDLELLRKVSEDPPPPLLAAAPELDPDLAAFVHQLLAKTKQERPASAQSIVTVLDSFLLRQGYSHEQMQHELAIYTARYAQGRALSTRTAIGAGTRSEASPPSRSRESRPPTRALTPGSGSPPEHHTRITSESGVAAALAADFPPSRPDVGGGVHQASTNSALFVPPPEQVKAPVYLWIAMATGLFSLLIALSALFLVSSRGPQGDVAAVQPPAVVRTGPSGLAPVATAEPTATAAPPATTPTPTPSASSSAATTAPPPSPPKTGTTAPMPVRKPPSAACTPMSFDYPRCLKK
jgi:serine/threonine-protein kinase